MIAALAGFIGSASFTVLVPAVVLLALLVLAVFVLWRAQRRDDFDVANMLKDDAGKESALRFGVLVSLAVSSWGVVYLLMNGRDAIDYWVVYLATWSGALVFIRLADRWDGRLPWAQGGQQP